MNDAENSDVVVGNAVDQPIAVDDPLTNRLHVPLRDDSTHSGKGCQLSRRGDDLPRDGCGVLPRIAPMNWTIRSTSLAADGSQITLGRAISPSASRLHPVE